MAKRWDTRLTGVSLEAVRSPGLKNPRAVLFFTGQTARLEMGMVDIVDKVYRVRLYHQKLDLAPAIGVGSNVDEAVANWFDQSVGATLNTANSWRYALLGHPYQANEPCGLAERAQQVRTRVAEVKGRKK